MSEPVSAEEQFETFDDEGRSTGLVARSEVHRRGLWHRSAHVFVFNRPGQMLIQQRVAHKDLYPGLWDYAVGEHLQPGESFLAGALRGLREELGVTDADLSPVGAVRKSRLVGEGVIDAEEQQAYRCVLDGPFQPDPGEVAQVRFVEMPELVRDIEAEPARFTPWFIRDLRELGLIGSASV